jgi:putative neutral zinc metallopeptidase
MIPNYDPIYIIITGLAMLVSQLVGTQMKRAFAKYSREPMPVTGHEIAERMLRENGINDVQVQAAQGMLTDHYDPAGMTVNLSEPVYAVRRRSPPPRSPRTSAAMPSSTRNIIRCSPCAPTSMHYTTSVDSLATPLEIHTSARKLPVARNEARKGHGDRII